jgi:hypothetical protein
LLCRPGWWVLEVFRQWSANLGYGMLPDAGLSRRPRGEYSVNARTRHPQQVKGVAGGRHRCDHRSIIIGLLGKFFAPGTATTFRSG